MALKYVWFAFTISKNMYLGIVLHIIITSYLYNTKSEFDMIIQLFQFIYFFNQNQQRGINQIVVVLYVAYTISIIQFICR